MRQFKQVVLLAPAAFFDVAVRIQKPGKVRDLINGIEKTTIMPSRVNNMMPVMLVAIPEADFEAPLHPGPS